MSTTGQNGNSTTGTLPARVPSTAGGRGPFFIRPLPVPVVLTGTEAEHYGKESKVTRGGPVSQKKAAKLRRLLQIEGVTLASNMEEVAGGQ